MSRLIQNELKKPLAEEILFGSLKKGGRARMERARAETDGGESLKVEILTLSPSHHFSR